MPIETAPKDGTEIKVRGRDWGFKENKFHYAEVQWRMPENPNAYQTMGWRPAIATRDDFAMVYLTDWKPK